MEIKPGSYPVVIGAGGAADSDGNPSNFNGLSANGGGAAYKSDASYGGNGGSGGGLWGSGGSDGGNGSRSLLKSISLIFRPPILRCVHDAQCTNHIL